VNSKGNFSLKLYYTAVCAGSGTQLTIHWLITGRYNMTILGRNRSVRLWRAWRAWLLRRTIVYAPRRFVTRWTKQYHCQ